MTGAVIAGRAADFRHIVDLFNLTGSPVRLCWLYDT